MYPAYLQVLSHHIHLSWKNLALPSPLKCCVKRSKVSQHLLQEHISKSHYKIFILKQSCSTSSSTCKSHSPSFSFLRQTGTGIPGPMSEYTNKSTQDSQIRRCLHYAGEIHLWKILYSSGVGSQNRNCEN